MISARDTILLDVAYDLVSEVHTNICNSMEINNKEELSKEAFDVLRKVCLLGERLKGQC